jgi:hypothetical protein
MKIPDFRQLLFALWLASQSFGFAFTSYGVLLASFADFLSTESSTLHWR